MICVISKLIREGKGERESPWVFLNVLKLENNYAKIVLATLEHTDKQEGRGR